MRLAALTLNMLVWILWEADTNMEWNTLIRENVCVWGWGRSWRRLGEAIRPLHKSDLGQRRARGQAGFRLRKVQQGRHSLQVKVGCQEVLRFLERACLNFLPGSFSSDQHPVRSMAGVHTLQWISEHTHWGPGQLHILQWEVWEVHFTATSQSFERGSEEGRDTQKHKRI